MHFWIILESESEKYNFEIYNSSGVLLEESGTKQIALLYCLKLLLDNSNRSFDTAKGVSIGSIANVHIYQSIPCLHNLIFAEDIVVCHSNKKYSSKFQICPTYVVANGTRHCTISCLLQPKHIIWQVSFAYPKIDLKTSNYETHEMLRIRQAKFKMKNFLFDIKSQKKQIEIHDGPIYHTINFDNISG